MTGTHDTMTMLAPAYALDALDDEECRMFETHLADCPVCIAEVRSLRKVAAGLAHATVQVTPRPEVRERILTAVGAPAAGLSTAVRRSSSSAGPAASARWIPYAAVVAIAASFSAYSWSQRNRIADLEVRVGNLTRAAEEQEAAGTRVREQVRLITAERDAALAILAAPDLVRIDLAGEGPGTRASARAHLSRQRGILFAATGLPAPEAGRVYQLWVITSEPEPISVGLFVPDSTGYIASVYEPPARLGAPLAVAVTSEPEGGVPAPTGGRYLLGVRRLPRPATPAPVTPDGAPPL